MTDMAKTITEAPKPEAPKALDLTPPTDGALMLRFIEALEQRKGETDRRGNRVLTVEEMDAAQQFLNKREDVLREVDKEFAPILSAIETKIDDGRGNKAPARKADEFVMKVNRAFRNLFKNVREWGGVPIEIEDDGKPTPGFSFVEVKAVAE